MEFPSLGERCTMASCQQLDLLPICCNFCKNHFCKTHFQPFDHSCPSESVQEALATNFDKNPNMALHICSLSNCSVKELVCMPCSHCQLHFCLHHRHQIDHQCLKLEKIQEKMVQTAALVKQITEKTSGKKVSQGVKSEKLASKVQLMKLKQHSKGINELPSEERVYFLVHSPLNEDTVAVFVSKCWSVGKSIDYIASVGNIKNCNNFAGKPHLNLFTCAGLCLSDKKDILISELIEKEIVFNGQTVYMKYIENSTN